MNIASLELFPIVLSLYIWRPLLVNNCVASYTDNAAIVDVINKQTSKHPLIMILARHLVLTTLTYNILFRARHIPGVHNAVADCILRFQVEQLKKISPGADKLPTPVPTHLLNLKIKTSKQTKQKRQCDQGLRSRIAIHHIFS